MARVSEIRELVISVFVEQDGLLPKEVIELVQKKNQAIETRQIHNFLCNNLKTGIFFKKEDGRYYLSEKIWEGKGMESENQMINALKSEIEEIFEKHLKRIENPFDKFEGVNLLQAKELHTYIKNLKRRL